MLNGRIADANNSHQTQNLYLQVSTLQCQITSFVGTDQKERQTLAFCVELSYNVFNVLNNTQRKKGTVSWQI